MCLQSRRGALQTQELQVESVLLAEINSFHPGHLTIDELVLRLEDKPSRVSRVAIQDAISALRRSGVVRVNGQVVEPTHTARRVLELAFL
jgi:hypothetical protein